MPEARAGSTREGASADTIFAPATGAGRAAIAVVRISGPEAHAALISVAGKLPPWRELTLRRLLDGEGEEIDHAMVVAFPEGASYTGEAMAEIHCHGGTAVLAGVLARLADYSGCRLAAPGEFTRRALVNGRMDLPAVEGLADLIAAETAAQRRQALRVHAGAVSRQTEAWRGILMRARALIELAIDWADEEVPEDVASEARALLTGLAADMDRELSRAAASERMRSGYEVAIVGPPNVGKSSLLNAIAGREAAIVSEVAGTTRDVLEVRFDLNGLPVTFLDTAGLREARDEVERIGVERARRRAEAADLRVHLSAPDVDGGEDGLWREGDLRVWSKCDLRPGIGDVAVSALRDEGIGLLLALVRTRVAERTETAGVLSTVRQGLAVENARDHVRRCLQMLGRADPELASEELRLATDALDQLVGRIGVEHVLGEIFGSFCLGK